MIYHEQSNLHPLNLGSYDKQGRHKGTTLLVSFAISLFLYVGSRVALHKVGEIDSEEREDNHACYGEYYRNDMPLHCHRIDVAAYGRDVHSRPPESHPVVGDVWVHTMLILVKYERAEIDYHKQYHKIRHEETCDSILREIAEYNRDGESRSGQRYVAKKIPVFHIHRQMKQRNQVQIRDGNQKKRKTPPCVFPFIGGESHLYEIVRHEDYAHPELEADVEMIGHEVLTLESVVRDKRYQDSGHDYH